MADFNALNRGVYIADNLDFLRRLNTECIDLVCIDPPFAKNETFTGDRLRPPLSKQERDIEARQLKRWGVTDAESAEEAGITWPETEKVGGGYVDIWSWEKDIHEDWLVELESRDEGVQKLIDATRYVHGDSISAYLCYMAIRLIEIRRVLKPSGSLYLHCDHTANGYIRQLLDGIFGTGEDNSPGFRNEVIWRSTSAHSDAKRYGANTESILFYSKGTNWTWNTLYEPYDEKYKARFRFKDADGRLWQDDNLTAKGLSGGGYEYEYKGKTELWRVPLETMKQLDVEGRLHFTRNGGIRRKRYLDEMAGRPVQQLWTDIGQMNSQAKERTGYPTQKPVALAERIIRASSNKGDVVPDCFAGCAYAAVAAERLERRWVACDMNPRAWTVFKRQFSKPELTLLTCEEITVGQQVQGNQPRATVHGPKQLPKRSSPLSDDWNNLLKVGRAKPTPSYKKASEIDRPEMMERLLKLSEYKAWCCGFANRMSDGSVRETTDNFHLDHIRPKSKGGTDRIYNRAPLCPKHNTSKGNREIELEKLRVEIALNGEMLVGKADELIDLDWAFDRAMEIFAIEYTRQHASEQLV